MSSHDTVTDADLIASCAAVIDQPKAAAADSFVLHAPLELLARAILLERVPESQRPLVRERMQWLAGKYAAAGPTADPVPAGSAIGIDDMLLTLAAAGHAPILASLRRRVPAVPSTFGTGLVAAELGRYPDWRLSWPRAREVNGAPSGDLVARLAAPRSPGDPGSDFIYPTMHLVDESGLADEILGAPLRGMQVDAARQTLMRIAAHSMLQDNRDVAPYGWTHCLTMPQAVLVAADHGADPDVAVAVAGLYVLGFRSTQGKVRIEPAWTPPHGTAAGDVWWAPEDEVLGIIDNLASFGAVHPDAHVAKYTLACLDATAADPDAGRLFLAAAAHLHEYWKPVAFPGDPILGRYPNCLA